MRRQQRRQFTTLEVKTAELALETGRAAMINGIVFPDHADGICPTCSVHGGVGAVRFERVVRESLPMWRCLRCCAVVERI